MFRREALYHFSLLQANWLAGPVATGVLDLQPMLIFLSVIWALGAGPTRGGEGGTTWDPPWPFPAVPFAVLQFVSRFVSVCVADLLLWFLRGPR